ncbi:MTH1187 family thiamine-binding protein [Archaeoglobus veneficus]|uniref:Thiamine-binding protein domain-containing protein n=1 Tax=Archaeoglobus veneficus (strain DSM 11195 / SNP6) TaxID=693661 RepID=F2KP84_ARCVS|nr:MTH1187 family thiamine-binding protein [Archaeoglobus veneficus]AEA47488.1 protein of unknown function DUF77 [Archaeoglobus veneficus SNP6]
MIVEISVVPIGVGESLSSYVSEALKVIREKGVKYQLNPMGTVLEVDSFSELGELLDEIRCRLEEMGAPRIYVVVKADWRKKATDMEHKVKAVEEKLRS